MQTRIIDNLDRQDKGLALLQSLLEEEFSQLRGGDPQLVMQTEFSIHELMRQLVEERDCLKRMLGGGRLLAYADALAGADPALAERVKALIARIDAKEQLCARHAGENSQLALGLMDQSQSLLDYLHDMVVPKNTNVYSARGRFAQPRPGAALFRGTL